MCVSMHCHKNKICYIYVTDIICVYIYYNINKVKNYVQKCVY